MTAIAVIGDVHDERGRLERVLGWLAPGAPALALVVGDVGLDPPWNAPDRRLSRRAHDDSVRAVLGTVRERLRCPVLFVPGNHDLPDPVSDLDALNCDRRTIEIDGLRVAGFGGAGPARFGFPYEWDEHEAAAALASVGPAADGVDVMLSHTPPAHSRLDRTSRGEHVGSESLRRWIGVARPRLFVCGHIHEAWGVERIEGVPCLNAGALGEPWGQEIGWEVRWGPEGPVVIRSYRDVGGAPHREDWPATNSGGI